MHLDYDIRTLLSLDVEFEPLGHIFKHSRLNLYNYHGLQLNNRRFCDAFGCSARECSLAWLLVVDGLKNCPKQATKIRFLWALSLLKTNDTVTIWQAVAALTRRRFESGHGSSFKNYLFG